ncbi:MAG: hypothetical protein AAGN46_05615 [Acidobacteriota bacterium]
MTLEPLMILDRLTPDHIRELGVALVSIASAAAGGIAWLVRRRRALADATPSARARAQHLYLSGLRMEVYQALRAIVRETTVDRALILRSENGGGRPKPGAPLFVRALYEDRTTALPSMLEDWERRPVDARYHELLDALLRTGHCELEVAALDADSTLGTLYRAHGVDRGEVHVLAWSERSIYYLELHRTDAAADALEALGPAARARETYVRDSAIAEIQGHLQADDDGIYPPDALEAPA